MYATSQGSLTFQQKSSNMGEALISRTTRNTYRKKQVTASEWCISTTVILGVQKIDLLKYTQAEVYVSTIPAA